MGGSSSKPKPKPAPAAKPAPPAAPKKPALLDSAVATTQVATRTDPGSGADDEDNQDAVHLSESGGVHVVALFDGHGDDGKAVADACAAAVLGCGVGKLKASGDAEAIAGCFQALHTGVCAEKGVDASESGASATVVVYDSNERAVLVGNAGDSKAVIGRGASGATGDGGPRRPAPMVLTSDHYPKVPAEKARIEAAGGRVHATDDVQLGAPPPPPRPVRPRARARRDARRATPAHRPPPRPSLSGELGDMRVWKPGPGGEKLGLHLSRTVGDAIATEVGVTSEPAATKVALEAGDRCLIVASSGVWKVFSPADAVEVVLQHGDADAAAEAIVVEARKRWDELWQGANTTVAVVVFASP